MAEASTEENRGRPFYPERDPFWNNRLAKPTIAAINGLAHGGGWFLVHKTDFRVAAEGATFRIAEINVGLIGDYMVQSLHSLGSGVAAELTLGGLLTAERLYQVGFLNRVVPADAVMPASLALAEQLLALPPLALEYTTKLMHMVRERSRMRLSGGFASEHFPEGKALAEEAIAALRDSADGREARARVC